MAGIAADIRNQIKRILLGVADDDAIEVNRPSERNVLPAAFGYSPERWPSPKTFGEPVTAVQVKMTIVKSRERGIPAADLSSLRTVVLDAYGVGQANSRGNASLFIDWLMNADEDSIDDALQTAACHDDAFEDIAWREEGAA